MTAPTPTPARDGRAWRLAMVPRDPDEAHRASTPLELLFDLCFVVAVSQAAASLHHALGEGHIAHGLVGFGTVFFAIWWAWMNFTWFASAYDVDDVPYRLLTLMTIVGVLVLAAGVPDAFDNRFALVTIGYAIMRVALVAQWLRAAAGDADGRAVDRRYAVGVGLAQVGWILRLLLPGVLSSITFPVMVVVELAVPVWAERAGRSTRWHPEHIAERYGLFTIIVLGECILAATNAVQSALTSGGFSAELLVISGAAIVVVFGLWWAYFQDPVDEVLREHPDLSFVWGYSHYFVFAAIAALGAGLAVAAESVEHDLELSTGGVALAVGVPIAIYLVLLGLFRVRLHRTGAARQWCTFGVALVVLVAALAVGPTSLALSLVVMAGAVVVLVAVDVRTDHRVAARDPVI